MDAGNIKRQALGLVIGLAIGALACVLVWKVAPLFNRSDTKVTQGPHVPAGSILVNVSMVGFDPATIDAKAGQPIRLAFYRPNAQNCASEVVFPALGIRKELPPGQTTVVEITPPKSGPLVFACGMNMLKGKLIVR
jgi:plastocyanin domain-containing protein